MCVCARAVYANIWKLHTANSPVEFMTSLDYDVICARERERHFFPASFLFTMLPRARASSPYIHIFQSDEPELCATQVLSRRDAAGIVIQTYNTR